jgi:hypothetical protein
MLTGTKLRRINDRPRRANRLLLLTIGGGSVTLAALLYGPLALPMLAPVALLAGVLGVVGVYRAYKADAITSLSYEGKLDEGASARFSEVSEALEALASSERVWHLTGAVSRPAKAEEAAPTPVWTCPSGGWRRASSASFSSPRVSSSTREITTSPSLTNCSR